MSAGLQSVLPSALILGTVAGVALSLTLGRGWRVDGRSSLQGAVRIAAVAVLLQGVHFAEELATGFPELFGLAPMSLSFFVAFNVGWLAVWSLSVWGLAARQRAALFPLCFLALASLLNGVAHPLLSLRAGGYFPGLVTSIGVGILGALLLRRLLALTARRAPPTGSSGAGGQLGRQR